MNKAFLYSFMLICMPLSAEIYTWIGSDGSRYYGDRPPQSSTTATTVPESIYASPAVGWVSQSSQALPENQPAAISHYYRRLEILRPGQDESVRNTTGTVEVVIDADPPLRQGDVFTLYLDDEVIDENFSADMRVLSGVYRGTHTLKASISGRRGAILISSEHVTFQLHRPSRLQPQRNKAPNP